MLDALIVGGRCAGATLAIHLARAGKRVLVVDAGELPSDLPLSTHWISPGGMTLLDELGLGDRVRSFAPPLPSMLYGADGAGGRLDYPAGRRASCPRRRDLDNVLCEAAIAAGAEVRTRTRVIALLREGDRVVGAVVQQGDHREELRARVVVGADGHHSTVADLVHAAEYHGYDAPRAMYWAYWPRPSWYDDDRRYLGAALNRHVGENIFFVFPTNRDLLLLGIAFPLARLADWKGQHKGHQRAKLQSELARYDLTAPLAQGEPVTHVIGAIKLRFFFREAAGPGWALVGDAGMFLEPAPGFGITDALRDARELARAITHGGDEALARYWRERDACSIDLFEYARNQGSLHHNNPLGRLLYTKVAGDAVLRDRLVSAQNRERSPFSVFEPKQLVRWVAGAVLTGQLDVVKPFLRMAQRRKAIQAEIALRKRLADEARAAVPTPSLLPREAPLIPLPIARAGGLHAE